MYLKISRHQLEIWWSQIEFTGDAIPVLYLKISRHQLVIWWTQI